jgi:polyprenyldihydroxybenzoate methyltransferase/3-demethylubiquinol 3-O-methyltransferase
VTLEALCENVDYIEKYDAIIASEVLEHINDVDSFIGNISKLLKPKGHCFVTTLNQTIVSYVFGILAAEYILRIVPPGTHTWNKFIRPIDLITLFEKNGFSVLINNGMMYNPITNRWSWSKNQAINYALCAVKN